MKLYQVLIGVGLILFITSVSLVYLLSNNETKDGDCFDKYGNKIQGVTCDIKEGGEWTPFLVTGIVFGTMALAIGSAEYSIEKDGRK